MMEVLDDFSRAAGIMSEWPQLTQVGYLAACDISLISRIYDHTILMEGSEDFEEHMTHACAIVYYRARIAHSRQEWGATTCRHPRSAPDAPFT